MRRLAPFLVVALGALCVWLAPKPSPEAPAPADGRPDKQAATPAKHQPRPAQAPGRSPAEADAVFNLYDDGARKTYAVALDEVYRPDGPVDQRLERVAPQADLPSLLRHAAALGENAPDRAPPRLVLYPAGATRDDRVRRILNPRVEVVLASADAPSPPLRPDLGIVSWERPSYAPDRAIARIVGDAAQPLRAALAAADLPGIRSARPLLARQRFHRRVLNDPMLGNQWHLGLIRAAPSWDSATGSGVVVGIVDNGVDLSHPDLSPALDRGLGYDWNDNDNDPSAENHEVVIEGDTYYRKDDHGTAVAGLASARGGNRVGGAGSAPSSAFAALRLIAAPVDDAEEAAAMSWRNDAIWVKNNSWGPYDYYPDVSPAPSLWQSAVLEGVTNGREGLGVLYFWAAGNGQKHGDQGSLDGYASARPVIAVAATGKAGNVAGFSEGGPHLVVAAPGESGIVTTDRVGAPGYTRGSYTSSFNGTSAATPIAAGVGAQLLEARPDLGWRDVKEIFLRSSTRLLSTSPEWTSRPAGDTGHPIKHHPRLGGGLVNALSALTLARNWRPLGPETELSPYPTTQGSMLIPDNRALPFSLAFEIPDGSPVLRVEHVVMNLDITHTYRGDLEITLVSPSGTTSRFTKNSSRMSGEDYQDYPFTSVRHWGEESHIPGAPSRRWTLRIRDTQPADSGYLNSVSLTLYGTPLEEPAVVAPPAGQTLATGSTLVLRGDFSGGNLNYVWRRDGDVIPGADGPEYRLANFTSKHAGLYTCTATNALGSASADAEVVLNDSPRGTFDIRAGTNTSLDLSPYVPGEVALWKAAGLPAGLRLDPLTGVLGGRPTKIGAFPVVVTATTRDGAIVRLPLFFSVSPLPAEFVGSYVALIEYDPELPPDLDRNGILTFTTSATGRATGLLRLGNSQRSISIPIDRDDAGQPVIVHRFTHIGQTFELNLTIGSDGGVSGLFFEDPHNGAADAAVRGRPAPWSARARPATAHAGVSNIVYAADIMGPVNGGGNLWIGPCLLQIRAALDGIATWTLTPSDGSPALRGSTPLGDGGELHLFAPYAKSLGAVQGTLRLPAAPNPKLPEGDRVFWHRRAAPAWAQPGGFGNSRLSQSGGGLYTPPAPGERALDLPPDGALEALRSAAFDDLGMPLDLAENLTLDPSGRISVGSPNPAALGLTLAQAAGVVRGTFNTVASDPQNPDSTLPVKAAITALVLPDANHILGFYTYPPVRPGARRGSGFILVRPPQADE